MSIKQGKTRITLSIPTESAELVTKLAEKYGMTKSGVVAVLIREAEEAGTLFRR
jgi:Ribbon-helix-helix protein, copG family.